MCGWCGADIELSVIGVAMEIESMMANDLTKGEHVDGEEDGAEDRALRHTLVDWGGWRARAV